MTQLFHLLLYQPLLNALVFFYNLIPDTGVAIVLLTILIRLILWPLSSSTYKSQRALQSLQPEVKQIQEKHKNNRAEMTRELMNLYKKEKINPLSSCLPLLIQFPVLIALYRVFQTGLDPKTSLSSLYPFIKNPGHLPPYSFGIINLSAPSLVFALLAGIAQYFQTKMLPQIAPGANIPGGKDEKMTATLNRQMVYFMPAFTVIIGMTLPAGLTIYWFITTLVTIVQQWYSLKRPKKKLILSNPTNQLQQ